MADQGWPNHPHSLKGQMIFFFSLAGLGWLQAQHKWSDHPKSQTNFFLGPWGGWTHEFVLLAALRRGLYVLRIFCFAM
jgi:hypothetical protein